MDIYKVYVYMYLFCVVTLCEKYFNAELRRLNNTKRKNGKNIWNKNVEAEMFKPVIRSYGIKKQKPKLFCTHFSDTNRLRNHNNKRC